MYDPIMRVLTVLEILQSRENVTGEELAERLEVSSRTVQRYIARLQDLCIPVEAARGVGGCYRLKPGFRLPPLMFTDEEAFALTLGLRALRQLGLSAFAPATEGAAAKLGRVLPESLRESVRTIEEVIAVEPGPWVVSTSADVLIQVSTAIRAHHRLAFDYQSHTRELTQRRLDPYGVLHLDGRWYMAGFCLSRQALRTFRLDRVTHVRILEESFERPVGFDIVAHMQQSMPFVESNFAIEVWLDLPLREVASHFAYFRVVMEERSGGTVLRCGRDRLNLFAAMLLSLECRICVIQPQELRDVFTTLGERALQASGEPGVQCSARSGNVNANVEPCPGVDSTQI